MSTFEIIAELLFVTFGCKNKEEKSEVNLRRPLSMGCFLVVANIFMPTRTFKTCTKTSKIEIFNISDFFGSFHTFKTKNFMSVF